MGIRNSLVFFVIAQPPSRQASEVAESPCRERETTRQPRTVRHRGENSGWQEPTLAGLAIIIAGGNGNAVGRGKRLLDSPGLSSTEARTAGGRNPPWQG